MMMMMKWHKAHSTYCTCALGGHPNLGVVLHGWALYCNLL